MKYLVLILSLALTSCQSYASFVKSAEDHEVNSCIEGDIDIGYPLVGGGKLHVYTGTGGQKVNECIKYFRNYQDPIVIIQQDGMLRLLK